MRRLVGTRHELEPIKRLALQKISNVSLDIGWKFVLFPFHIHSEERKKKDETMLPLCQLAIFHQTEPPTQPGVYGNVGVLLLLFFSKETRCRSPLYHSVVVAIAGGLRCRISDGRKDKRRRRRIDGRQKQKHPHPDRRRSSFAGSTCVQHVRA